MWRILVQIQYLGKCLGIDNFEFLPLRCTPLRLWLTSANIDQAIHLEDFPIYPPDTIFMLRGVWTIKNGKKVVEKSAIKLFLVDISQNL